MIDLTWILFIATSLVLIVTPGQDMVLVMSRSVAQGAKAGIVTAAGVSIGLVGVARPRGQAGIRAPAVTRRPG